MADITIADLLKSVGRELGMRKGAYPRRVQSRRMTQENADHEIACMDALYKMLKEMHEVGVTAPSLADAGGIILYADRADLDEIIAAFKAAKPNARTVKLP